MPYSIADFAFFHQVSCGAIPQRGRAAHQHGVGLRAPQQQVDRMLPREADAAMNLHRDLGGGDGRVEGGGWRRGRRHSPRPRGLGGGQHLAACAFQRDQHVRAAMGDRLEATDRPAELLALARPFDGHCQGPRADADRVRRHREQRLAAGTPQTSRSSSPGDQLARGPVNVTAPMVAVRSSG